MSSADNKTSKCKSAAVKSITYQVFTSYKEVLSGKTCIFCGKPKTINAKIATISMDDNSVAELSVCHECFQQYVTLPNKPDISISWKSPQQTYDLVFP
jgi:hypothetical protein